MDFRGPRASNNLVENINTVPVDSGVSVSIEQWPPFGVISVGLLNSHFSFDNLYVAI